MGFFRSLIKELIDDGNIVDIATNEYNGETAVPDCYREWGCRVFPLSCSRSPLDSGNLKAIRKIRQIVTDDHYDIVHCHTPIAAACTRIACRKVRRSGTRVFYTAHGFHFYDGAPRKNWIVYYPVEKWLSKYTDVLITINKEDYKRAKEKFSAKKTVYVPGVGIDTNRYQFTEAGRSKIRKELGIDDTRKILLSVGELNENKNHGSVICAIKGMDLIYVIVGSGPLNDHLSGIAYEAGVDLRLMGHRDDVVDFYSAADLYILPSIREGLNVSLMEAMSCGLPCLAGNIRGNVDLLNGRTEFLFDPNSIEEISAVINNTLHIPVEELREYGSKNKPCVSLLDVNVINKQMQALYTNEEVSLID